ncbi:MAG: bifunctional diaminohydroxyphosphoribosylaminopyrimidine deaminase/5-amino-6-(5-phosphoribosylamino)uracil reductase RibD [Abditibacteriota bacterium]|nr:bifunctional diaminohydroxyphosphoribosylaminopyrimidine deaminase/5-amino-6-(5-phosphoribosylamino)uracil reductase RibD [Abditibacteriota bacterium]
MRRAIGLAEKYDPSPNPRVGAVIVRDGKVIGEGAHRRAGLPHAEINALLSCASPAGADMYVTLEPCCHYGKTPPCADALIEAGIARVFIGMSDPDPRVAGGGIKRLRKAGIATECGILEEECRRLNREYITHRTLKRPYVVIKQAMTLDGRTATRSGDSKWISCPDSRRLVHELRNKYDAVLVGGNTFRRDDPFLNVRLDKAELKQPVRIVLTENIPAGTGAHIFSEGGGKTVFACGGACEGTEEREGCTLLHYLKGDLGSLLKTLASLDILSVMVEGGAATAGSFIKADLWDEILFFYAPLLLNDREAPGQGGGEAPEFIKDARRVRLGEVCRIGEDVMLRAYRE